jgi:TusA-related sulfurtransferase
MRDEAVATEVDGRGRSISTAILYDVVTALRDLGPGMEVSVRTDPLPAVDSDLRAWCQGTGNELLAVDQRAGERSYLIRKAGAPRARPPWALVLSDPGLEELLSPLGFSLAAALAGSRVAIYFQGPAARVPTRGFRERLKVARPRPRRLPSSSERNAPAPSSSSARDASIPRAGCRT